MSELPSVTLPEFQPWPKIFRWQREWIITEKLDGTNACVYVADSGLVLAGSRNRWLSPATPGDGKSKANDNYGFASWVKEHEEELKALGPGYHYGEWWGKGIARHYDMQEKVFSLFNVTRWTPETLPKCCRVVPVLERVSAAASVTDAANYCMSVLRTKGSQATGAPFMNPEGIVIFHEPSRAMFKKTMQHDEKRKEEVTAAT